MVESSRNKILLGDAREKLATLPDESVHMVCTSPPYFGQRDYGVDGQMGMEPTLDEYVANMVAVFREVKRVLRSDGACFVNLGDSYTSGGRATRDPGQSGLHPAQPKGTTRAETPAGLKPKDLIGVPWRLALALQADGWYLRSAFPWVKRGVMPESVTDRATSALEYIFQFTKSQKYFADMDAVRKPAQDWGLRDRSNFRNGTTDPLLKHHGFKDGNSAVSGRNLRNADLWFESIGEPHGLVGVGDEIVGLDRNTARSSGEHYASYPEALVLPFIKMGTSEHGVCAECGSPYIRLTGWQPTCKHDAPVVPGIVLDPFIGSGTTALVALKAGRDFVGIELNPEYVAMAQRRLDAVGTRLL